LLLSKIASQVYVVHRRDKFRGEEILIDRVLSAPNTKIIYNSQVKEIVGEQVVSGIITSNEAGEENKVDVNGVFIEIGFQVKGELVKNLVKLDSNNQIIVSQDSETSTPGIFAAGDVTSISYKQIVISAGEGAKAALQAYKYLNAGKSINIGVDWGIKKKINK